MRRLNIDADDFESRFDALLARDTAEDAEIVQTVQGIIDDVRKRRDQAVLEYTARFDRLDAAAVSELEVGADRIEAALTSIPKDTRVALETAAARVRDYHQRQKQESWRYTSDDGTQLGQQITALDSVGLYVPGGKAAYPSSVLMNAIPAKVAGVEQLIMTVPAPEGKLNDAVLAAAALTGVDRVFTIGGAQAVAALAYGTETVPAVDKIVGPGNAWVAAAKRQVFGKVGIDMIAGPSEVLIISDGTGDPEWLAMDLFAQAEHDEQAQSILISQNAEFLDRVDSAIEKLLPGMERREIIRAALEKRGALIQVADIEQAIALANRMAPEHLELAVDNPLAIAEQIRHAGAIFAGHYTAEVLGDYCAGPNHVLPTSGTARFSSPLGVYDFQKRSSLIMCTQASAAALGRTAATLARSEGLEAHARSADYRVTGDTRSE